MNKQELIDDLKKEIEATKNVSNFEEHVNLYEKGKRIGLEIGWMLAEKLDEPEIAEEQGFLEHLTRLFKKHGYDHLGQVALALENNLEIYINKELPVIPQFVVDYIEKSKTESYSLLGAMSHFSRENDIDVWIRENQETFAKAWIDGYAIEPPKTLQVIVKNYDSTVYKTELPEDEAMKLIEGWKG